MGWGGEGGIPRLECGGCEEGEEEEGHVPEDCAHVGVVEVCAVLAGDNFVHAGVLPSSWC